MTLTHAPRRRRSWYHPMAMWRSLMVRPRVIIAALVAGAVLFALPDQLSPAVRATLAWNAAGLIYLVATLRLMQSCNCDQIRQHAAGQDDSAVVILAIILVAIAASFVAIGGLLSEVKTASAAMKPLYLGLAALTILVSWSVTQLVFTVHYAHEFYAPPERQHDAENGLVFPDDAMPDYWDFFYFAATIGATSQTSDTAVRSKSLRRLVTLHAIVSFFFNTMVLALTINLAASLI